MGAMHTMGTTPASCLLVLTALIAAGRVAAAGAERPRLLPTPQRVAWLDGRVRVADGPTPMACVLVAAGDAAPVATGVAQLGERLTALGGGPLPVVASPQAKADAALLWVGTRAQLPQFSRLLGNAPAVPEPARVPDGYLLRCVRAGGRDIVVCVGHDARGAYYGLCTLAQLLRADGRSISMPRVEIVDWPTYRIRLVKVSATKCDPDRALLLARVLPRYKINVYALQYHPERDGTWRKPSARYRRVLTETGKLSRQQGVLEAAMFLCPFFAPKLDLTKPEDTRLYIDRLRWGIRQGCSWIEIDFNDWGTWKRLPPAEQALYKGPADFEATLTNTVYKAIRAEFPKVGVILCSEPAYYRGPATPDLVAICKAIPDDILVYWTGPVTRSRRITRQQVLDWTAKTGRKPFLWDNTIYAHFQPHWVGYAFNPFSNQFPDDLHTLLDGPGMHLNANATAHYLPGMLTYADYLWNPAAYDPKASIRTALALLWGKQAPDAAQQVQDRLVALYKWLYAAQRGWEPFDKAQADRMLDDLQKAADALARVAADPALAADLKAHLVDPARAAARKPTPRREFKPHPKAIAKPLGKGLVNPSVEDAVKGKPVGWSLYTGAGSARMTVSPDAHSGKHSLCLHAARWYHNPAHPKHGDRKWINVALIHGSEQRGFEGWDAYDVEPGKSYRCTFWLKGDVPAARVIFQGWTVGMRAISRHELAREPLVVEPTAAWTQHTASFRAGPGTRKLALKFALMGYEAEGMRLGKLWVDDVAIEPAE